MVVHVNFAQTTHQRMGLNNVENILKTAGAEGTKAEIEVVCHGEGIRLVEKARTELADEVAAMANQGVRFVACENTMRQRSLGRDDLVPNVGTVPSGAFEIVVRQPRRLFVLQAVIADHNPTKIPTHPRNHASCPAMAGFRGDPENPGGASDSSLGRVPRDDLPSSGIGDPQSGIRDSPNCASVRKSVRRGIHGLDWRCQWTYTG